jgi:hypothetical protein
MVPACGSSLTIGIKALRTIMWQGNVPRDHVVTKVCSCDSSGRGNEIMLYGTVTMHLPKEDIVLDWAGHMTLEDTGELRVKDYQVYGVQSQL